MTAPARITRAQPLTLQERRAALETAIAAAIDALDTLDGDADLEPSCGFICGGFLPEHADQRRWAIGGDQDEREEPHDADPDHDHACLNLELHDQRRPGTYAGEPLSPDPEDEVDEVVVRCEVGLC